MHMNDIKAFIKTHLIKIICVLVGITAIIFLTKCTGDSTSTTEDETVQVPVKTASVIKMNEEKQGGNLNIYMPKGATTLNPYRTCDSSLDDIYALIFEKVVYISSNNKPTPLLAESWEASADGMYYTVTLKSGVTFSNGAKLTSADVLYTYNYIKATSAGVTKYTDMVSSIASIEVIDDTHFKVTGTKAGLNTLYALNFPVLCKSYNNASTPMGSGPYKVSSYVKDSKLVLVPNTNWWKPQPYIKTITAICYSSEQDALEAFAKGDLDVIDTESISSDVYRKSASANRYKLNTTELNYLMMNTSKANLNKKVFRQALSYAIDKKKIINYVFISHADPVDEPIPPTDWRYSISYTQYDYDQEKAVSLFKSLGITQKEIVDAASGLKTYKLVQGSSQISLKLLIIDEDSSTIKNEIADNIRNDLAKVGISVTIVKQTYDAYLNSLKSGDYDLALCNVTLKNDMDISNMLTNNTAVSKYINYSRYYNATLLSYINNYASSTDETTILKNTELFEQLFTDEVPFICLNFRSRSLLIDDKVGGVSDIFTDNVFNGINEWYIK